MILCYGAAVAAKPTNGTEMAAKLQDTTGPPGTKYTWRQLPQAANALQSGKDIDYVGAGELNLNADGPTRAPKISTSSRRSS